MAEVAPIQASAIFRGLAAQHPNVEVWPDDGFAEGGYSFFWIVSKEKGAVRNLAYVRWKPGVLEKRTYDESGDDLWVNAQ